MNDAHVSWRVYSYRVYISRENNSIMLTNRALSDTSPTFGTLLEVIKTKHVLHPGHIWSWHGSCWRLFKMAAKTEECTFRDPRDLNIFALVYVSTYYVPNVTFISKSLVLLILRITIIIWYTHHKLYLQIHKSDLI